MTAWRTIGLVARREVRARGRAALLVMGATVVLIVAGIAIVSTAADPGAGPATLSAEEGDELVGFIGTVAMLMAIVFTGQVILLGVVEEKNSRVVEVLLGAVPARHLLAGKILGIGLIGLVEVLAAGGAVLAAGAAFDAVEIPATTGRAVGAVLLWFVLGYGLYATVFAAAGALVTRTESASNAAIPINLALLVGYFVGLSSIDHPDNPVLRVASLLPPIAPLTMPMRMANETVAPGEVALVAAATVAAAYGLVRLAGRVYLGGLMQTRKVGLRRAFRSAEWERG